MDSKSLDNFLQDLQHFNNLFQLMHNQKKIQAALPNYNTQDIKN